MSALTSQQWIAVIGFVACVLVLAVCVVALRTDVAKGGVKGAPALPRPEPLEPWMTPGEWTFALAVVVAIFGVVAAIGSHWIPGLELPDMSDVQVPYR